MKQLVMLFLFGLLIGLGYLAWKDMSKTNIDSSLSDVAVIAENNGVAQSDISNTLLGRVLPLPKWWRDVEEPLFKTVKDIDTEWRGRERCCVSKKTLRNNNRIFYKACYNYINSKNAVEEGIVKCLWLMGGSEDEQTRRTLRQILYDDYVNHKNRIDNCVNCATGDTVVRVTQQLAYYYSQEDANKSAELLETILDKRKDISPWVELEAVERLTRYYNEIGLNSDRAKRLQIALDKFTAIRDIDDGIFRRFPEFKTTVEDSLRSYTDSQ